MKKFLLALAAVAAFAPKASAFSVYVDGKEINRNDVVTSYNMEFSESYYWYCINPHLSVFVDNEANAFLTVQVQNITSGVSDTSLSMCWGGTCQDIQLGKTIEKMAPLQVGVMNELELEATRDTYNEGDTFNASALVTLIPDGLENNPFKFTLHMKYPDPTGGVEGIADEDAPAVYYNLQGIRVDNPVKGQLYILNGKKVIF